MTTLAPKSVSLVWATPDVEQAFSAALQQRESQLS